MPRKYKRKTTGDVRNRRGQGANFKWLQAHIGYQSDDCLIWPFSRDNQGYGHMGYLGKTKRAHIIMCSLIHGDPPTPKHQAAHSCGRGHDGCVHPKHLSWKTPQENAQDRIRHGNQSKAGRLRAKLNEDQVRQILEMKGSKTITKLGEMFGVSFSTISSIYCGRVWRSVSQVNCNAL